MSTSLLPLPERYGEGRDGYHRLAYAVVAEARRLATTRFGLRATDGGFGTPVFGDDEQVRVEAGQLVHRRGGRERRAAITSLAEAASFIGIEPGTAAAEPDSPALGDVDAPLPLVEVTGQFLARWYAFGWEVLGALCTDARALDADEIQLWPGHFDAATALGPPDRRATYGASPGDAAHDAPYLYIGPWQPIDPTDPFWNATGFAGAELSYPQLLDAENPTAEAIGFFLEGLGRLSAGHSA
ncbi:MAG: hypothetical protein R2695_04850 [Acidimicrobiales bacterium]